MSELNKYIEICLLNILSRNVPSKATKHACDVISVLKDSDAKIIENIDKNLLLRSVIKSLNPEFLSECKKANIDFNLSELPFNPLKELIDSYAFTLNYKMYDVMDTNWDESSGPLILSQDVKSLFFDLNLSSFKDFNPLKRLCEEFCKFQHESTWDLIETFYYSGFNPSDLKDLFFEGDMKEYENIAKKWVSEYQSSILNHEINSQTTKNKKVRRHVL